MKYYETKFENILRGSSVESLIRDYGFLGWKVSSIKNNFIVFQKEVIVSEQIKDLLKDIIEFLDKDSSTITENIIISKFDYYSSLMVRKDNKLESLIGSFIYSMDDVIDLDSKGNLFIKESNDCKEIHKNLKSKYYNDLNKFMKI